MKKILLLLCMVCTFTQAFAWKPIFAGHRGSYRGVENTEEAFMNAINFYKYTGIEIDVKTTKDGVPVCWHDDDLSRVGHSGVTIADKTWDELKDLTLTQTRSDVTYTATLCSVDRFLEICVEYDMFPIIELKWANGINNNDMSLFPKLYSIIEKHGMVDKAYILTSMQKSLEYVRTNFPDIKCQFLCYEVTETRYQWCLQWGITPSVQKGGLSKSMARKCHEAGMNVGVWTINSETDYVNHGNLGCYMMTCDYLRPYDMPELEDVDWEALAPIDPVSQLYITPLFNRTKSAGTLPENFPTTLGGDYTQAQEAAYIDGVFYMADYNKKKVVAVDTAGKVWEPGIEHANLRHGTCRDDAGNLILHTSPDVKVPTELTVYKAEDNTEHVIAIQLNNNGQSNFPTASGDIFSEDGGYIYFFPNSQKFVEAVKIANGAYVSTTSVPVSIAGSTAGYVIPISNNPAHFIYQVRADGYYLYKGADKGGYMASGSSTTAPARNSSVGGAFFTLAEHDFLVHASGKNYNGGWTIRDMTASELTPMYTQAPLGSDGYNGNASVGAFFWWERLDENTVNLYEYCLGSGIAGWEISTEPHKIRVQDLSLNETNITIEVGDTATITAIITPANANDQDVTWRYDKSSRTARFSSDGLTAKLTSSKEGTFTVTATLGEFSAECEVIFMEPTDVTNIEQTEKQTYKLVRDGQLYILHNNQTYTIIGQTK